jgi:hypothetical protein
MMQILLQSVAALRPELRTPRSENGWAFSFAMAARY